jgi:hypothetical protein
MCEKSKSDAILASTTSTSVAESESFFISVIHLVIYSDPVLDSTLDSVITVNMASANRSANCWILDTPATNHVTGNCHLFDTFHPMAEGEHHVKTANNSFVDAEGSESITVYIERPNAMPAKIVLEHVHYVPACCMNNLFSIIQFMRKGVNFDFKPNRATASLESVLVYEAPLINSLLLLNASEASVSKASVAVDDPTSTTANSEISEAYCNIRPAVDDKDIFVWDARLGHVSLAGIKPLPNTIKGIQLHAKITLICTVEACVMGRMFQKPFQPLRLENKAKTRLFKSIHPDVIGPMQPPTMLGYRYIIMSNDDHSGYTEVYFMTANSEAQAKFKEYVAKVEKQHQKSKVCPIRVDGESECASREKFLDYLLEEGIIREVSAPYSQHHNGILGRCNRTVLDPARTILKHAGMLNKLRADAMSTAVDIKNRPPSGALPNSTPFERWTQKTLDISHLRNFGCLAFAWIHGDLRKKLHNHAYKCVHRRYSETVTTCRGMNVSSDRVFIAGDVKFDESTLCQQLLKTKPTKFAFEPAEQDKDS